MPTQSQNKIADELFAGTGETAALMHSLNWSKTPLGPVDTWPQSLKTSVSICLNSRFPILIWWGREFVKLYNDSYVQLIGGKHPKALGRRGREVWPEIWDTIGPMLNGVLERGEATEAHDLLLFLKRHGYSEECYFTFSYSPIRDESGGIGGVFTPVMEMSEKVIGDRRTRTLRQLADLGGSYLKDANEACAAAAKVLSANPYDLPMAAIYLFDPTSDERRNRAVLAANATSETEPLAFPAVIDFDEKNWLPYSEVARGETFVIDLTDPGVGNLIPRPQAPWGEPPVQAIIVPILQSSATVPVGFLLAGVSIRKRLDNAYREFAAQAAGGIGSAIREAETLQRERSLWSEAEAERAKIRELFRCAPAAIAILHGPQHHYTLANERYLHLVGRKSMIDLIGKPLLDALPELAGQGIIELLDQVYRTGIPYTGSERAIKVERADVGQPVDGFFNFVYQPARDAKGQVQGILVLAVDVTEQVLARREIETREEQFRVLANSIPQMAWMANTEGFITWYNQRWYEYTGATPEQMEGGGTEFVHPEFLTEVLARYYRSMESGEPFDMVFPLRRFDGTFRSFLSLALPVRDGAGTIVRWFGTNTDVEVQEKAEAALRQSEKLAVVGRLASSIAHEINNPLEAVINLIYLARSTSDNDETKFYLQSAEQELERVSQITNQTLRFHKQQSAATSTDLAELFDSILTLYRGKLARDGIQLQMEKADCPPLVCYAGEVRQVLANLIGNAIDAMPRGGTLRLRVRPGTSWRNNRSGVRFTIADTGHGMSPETRKHIYEPFFTTKDEIGTGLGLWVCAGIVDKRGGSMHVRSDQRAGKSWTVFTLIFPHEGPAADVAGSQSQ